MIPTNLQMVFRHCHGQRTGRSLARERIAIGFICMLIGSCCPRKSADSSLRPKGCIDGKHLVRVTWPVVVHKGADEVVSSFAKEVSRFLVQGDSVLELNRKKTGCFFIDSWTPNSPADEGAFVLRVTKDGAILVAGGTNGFKNALGFLERHVVRTSNETYLPVGVFSSYKVHRIGHLAGSGDGLTFTVFAYPVAMYAWEEDKAVSECAIRMSRLLGHNGWVWKVESNPVCCLFIEVIGDTTPPDKSEFEFVLHVREGGATLVASDIEALKKAISFMEQYSIRRASGVELPIGVFVR